MYKCENCRVKKDIGDDVYLVESARLERFFPTCSKECAKTIRCREAEIVKTILDRIENTEIKKERW